MLVLVCGNVFDGLSDALIGPASRSSSRATGLSKIFEPVGGATARAHA